MNLRTRLEKGISDAGHRLTNARRAVIAAISEIDAHFEASEIVEYTRRGGSSASRATVYRTLDLLERLGLICQVHSDDLHDHYEPVRARQHHHLVCRECERTVEFNDERIDKIIDHWCHRHSFSPATHRLEVTGLCSRCSKASDSQEAALSRSTNETNDGDAEKQHKH